MRARYRDYLRDGSGRDIAAGQRRSNKVGDALQERPHHGLNARPCWSISVLHKHTNKTNTHTHTHTPCNFTLKIDALKERLNRYWRCCARRQSLVVSDKIDVSHVPSWQPLQQHAASPWRALPHGRRGETFCRLRYETARNEPLKFLCKHLYNQCVNILAAQRCIIRIR